MAYVLKRGRERPPQSYEYAFVPIAQCDVDLLGHIRLFARGGAIDTQFSLSKNRHTKTCPLQANNCAVADRRGRRCVDTGNSANQEGFSQKLALRCRRPAATKAKTARTQLLFGVGSLERHPRTVRSSSR
eukprot:2042189-Pleurochrysis_carterae.AAC.2